MKLSEAIKDTDDKLNRMIQIKDIIIQSKAPENKEQAIKISNLVSEFNRLSSYIKQTTHRINKTNALTIIKNKYTIKDAYDKLTKLQMKHLIFNEFFINYRKNCIEKEMDFTSSFKQTMLKQIIEYYNNECKLLDTQIQNAYNKASLL